MAFFLVLVLLNVCNSVHHASPSGYSVPSDFHDKVLSLGSSPFWPLHLSLLCWTIIHIPSLQTMNVHQGSVLSRLQSSPLYILDDLINFWGGDGG